MKTFKEYLAESKKLYSFKIKVAGPLPEGFEGGLSTRLGRCKVKDFVKETTTVVQALPLDFPQLKNMEVSIFSVMCEYPITAPEIKSEILMMGLPEAHFRVKNAADPSEEAQAMIGSSLTDTDLLTDDKYKEAAKVKHKDYFGADYNRSFLKDLEKTSKQRKKDLGQKDVKGEATASGPDFGAPSKSPVGSHQNMIPDPLKG
jgi:hypothetical protein